MSARSIVLPVLMVVALTGALQAQDVGSFAPASEWSDLTQTGAKKFDDFVGRLLVIEAFAHW